MHNYRAASLNWLQKGVQEVGQWVGEPCLVLAMYNPQNAPAEGIKHCPLCWSPIYKQSSTSGGICKACYGTGWEGGIKQGWFINAVRTNPSFTNNVDRKMGHLSGAKASLLLPGCCDVWEFDFVLFINGWEKTAEGNFKPMLKEAWQISTAPQSRFLKDGSINYSTISRAGSKVDIGAINMDHPISQITFDQIPNLTASAFFAPTPQAPFNPGAPIESTK